MGIALTSATGLKNLHIIEDDSHKKPTPLCNIQSDKLSIKKLSQNFARL